MDKKHIILLEADDELPDIYDKLEKAKEKKIDIFVPMSSLLLKSSINLKILKRKADQMKKEITIITKDKRYIKMIENAGLMAKQENIETLSSTTKEKKKAEEKQKNWREKIFQKILPPVKKNTPYPFVFYKPGKQPLIAFIAISVFFFFFILYIALPSATIYIRPTLKTQASKVNIEMVLSDHVGKISSPEDRIVPLYSIDIEYERTMTLTSTGKTFKGTQAKGKVTLYNTRSEPWSIVANSRLQTKDGIVFLTNYFVTVPGGNPQNPGTIMVDVRARETDANDLMTGSRGNISPTKLFLPGLSTFNQQLMYAQSFEPFSGGTDVFDYFVTKADLDVAKEKITSELQLSTVAELKKGIEKKVGSSSSIQLFNRSEKMITSQQLGMEIRAKENDKTNSFEAWGKIHAKGYYYNEEDLQAILINNLRMKHVSPTEKILKTKEHSLLIDEILEVNSEIPKVKITASLEVIVAYDFLNTNSDLMKTIRDTVVGKSKKEVEMFVNNQKEISEATVSIWPLWSPTLPTIPENIKIVVLDQ